MELLKGIRRSEVKDWTPYIVESPLAFRSPGYAEECGRVHALRGLRPLIGRCGYYDRAYNTQAKSGDPYQRATAQKEVV